MHRNASYHALALIFAFVIGSLASPGVFGKPIGSSPPAPTLTTGYCVAPDQTTYPLALTDVSFTIGGTEYTPTDCYGVAEFGPSSLSDNLTDLNDLRWSEVFVGGVKDDYAPAGGTGGSVGGINYVLTANPQPADKLTQDWTLSWSDADPLTPPNLPVLVDFAFLWNGGNVDVVYLFQNVLLSLAPNNFGSGTIEVNAKNNGSQTPGTSHLDVFFTESRTPVPDEPPPPTVPEPGVLVLMATALAVVTLAHRQKLRS